MADLSSAPLSTAFSKVLLPLTAVLRGSCCQYADLTNLHVSEDFRRRGIGSQLFNIASDFAKSIGAKKLYISSHSAIETQNFYKHMGCIDTKEPIASHVEAEPYDCQLEFMLE